MQGLGLKAVELSAAVSSEYLGTRLLAIFGGTRSALQDITVKAIDSRQLRPLPKTCIMYYLYYLRLTEGS